MHLLKAAVTLYVIALVSGCYDITSTSQRQPTDSIQTPAGSGGINHSSVIDRPYVVLVSFDGLRADYLDRVSTPHFDELAQSGVIAKGLIPVFPSLTFPSHYSVATGLYPEHHGIVGNRFYDKLRDEEFSYREVSNVRDSSWWGGEPIWLTAERQGMVAATMFFPGSEAAIGGFHPTHWLPYDARLPNMTRIDQTLDWLGAAPLIRPHLITLYFSLVDAAGHEHGPDDENIDNAVGRADQLLGRLLLGINQLPHASQVYVVVVSDHGMAIVDAERQIVLPEVVNLSGIRAIPTGPAMSLYLTGDEARGPILRDQFNAQVQDARAYLRDEIPSNLHLRSSLRTGDIVIVPKEGVLVSIRHDPSPPVGMHGWDPRLLSMHGIFLMRGPNVASGQRIEAFENVHIYPLLTAILGLKQNPDIDGQLGILGHLIR